MPDVSVPPPTMTSASEHLEAIRDLAARWQMNGSLSHANGALVLVQEAITRLETIADLHQPGADDRYCGGCDRKHPCATRKHAVVALAALKGNT